MNQQRQRNDLAQLKREIETILQKQQLVEAVTTRQTSRKQDLVESLVHRRHNVELTHKLKQLHSVEIAQLIERFPPSQRSLLWEQVSRERGGEVLMAMREAERELLIQSMPQMQLRLVLGQLDVDDVTTIAQDVPPTVLQERLKQLTREERQWFSAASRYPEDSAGSLAYSEVAVAYAGETQLSAVTRLRKQAPLPDQTDALFVIDHRSRYLGAVAISRLLLAAPDTPIESLMDTDRYTLFTDDALQEAIKIFDRYDLISTPVLNDSGMLIGRITIESIMEYLRQTSHDTVLTTAGLQEREDLFASAWDSAKNRWPWLFINLVTAFIASIVISFFETTIQQLVALAALMPIVASMGGNTGNQATAIMIRRLGQSDISSQEFRRMLSKESRIGLINGTVFALVVGLFAFALYHDAQLSAVIGVALVLILLISATIGVVAPAMLHHFGRDPALGSSILITAVTDILGFLVFLWLASSLLL